MMNKKYIHPVAFCLIIRILIGCGEGSYQLKEKSPADEEAVAAPDDSMKVYRLWRDLEDSEYLFNIPTQEQVASWKTLCESRNEIDPGQSIGALGYKSVNQYVTLWDFCGLWRKGNEESLLQDDQLTLWRLSQYNTVSSGQGTTERDKFTHLKRVIEDLCDFEPIYGFELNMYVDIQCALQEFYTSLLTKEAIRRSPRSIAEALEKEERAWRDYHAASDSAFIIQFEDPQGLGLTVYRAGREYVKEEARIREESVWDYYLLMTDGVANIEIRDIVPTERVRREYEHFVMTLEDEEGFYPLDKRRRMLKTEASAWLRWMKSRSEVSSRLSGMGKVVYDNATNNVKRKKLIALKNCYEDYGFTSQDVIDLLIPYSASEEELNGPNFKEKWKALYGD